MSAVVCDGTYPDIAMNGPGSTKAQCVEDFKQVLFKMQDARRKLVLSILEDGSVDGDELKAIKETLSNLSDSRTDGEMRHIAAPSATFNINIRDELRGLKKDVAFLERLNEIGSPIVDEALETIDLPSILAPFHPYGSEKFYEELEDCTRLLMDFIRPDPSTNDKPFFVTDWDGTMKDYCSQYATNLQPVYSAVTMGRFASLFTRVSAVLTAGPLRGPGILDLTALPINGPVMFSGSWGREWWLHGKRVLHDEGISDEAFVAIGRVNDEMRSLLTDNEFAQFALVGSGIQRKVDRITLGIQTVFNTVPEELVARYVDMVRERIHRVDPNSQILQLEEHNRLEIEVCAHSLKDEDGAQKVWDKADGVAALIESLKDSLKIGRVLVAGDTFSDVPMLKHVVNENPEGAMTIFVGASQKLRDEVLSVLPDRSRVCFISSPDVAHAAFAQVIATRLEVD